MIGRSWWRRGAAVLAVWGLLVGYAELTNRPFSIVALLPVALAVLAVWWFATDTAGSTLPPDWRPFRHQPVMRTFDSRFTRLRQDVTEIGQRPAAEIDVRRALLVASNALLLEDYGIDAVAQPAARADVLGADAVAFIDGAGPATRAGDLTYLPRLFAVLDRLETL